MHEMVPMRPVATPAPARVRGGGRRCHPATLMDTARQFAANPNYRGRLIEPPEVLGFERIGAGQNTIRITVRALRQDGAVARDLRYAALRTLAAHGIIAGSTDADPPHETPPTGETAS